LLDSGRHTLTVRSEDADTRVVLFCVRTMSLTQCVCACVCARNVEVVVGFVLESAGGSSGELKGFSREALDFRSRFKFQAQMAPSLPPE
jgi:hypothetical protein